MVDGGTSQISVNATQLSEQMDHLTSHYCNMYMHLRSCMAYLGTPLATLLLSLEEKVLRLLLLSQVGILDRRP